MKHWAFIKHSFISRDIKPQCYAHFKRIPFFGLLFMQPNNLIIYLKNDSCKNLKTLKVAYSLSLMHMVGEYVNLKYDVISEELQVYTVAIIMENHH
jgi:hypothetical protein